MPCGPSRCCALAMGCVRVSVGLSAQAAPETMGQNDSKNVENVYEFSKRSYGCFGETPNLLFKCLNVPRISNKTFAENGHRFLFRTNYSPKSRSDDSLVKILSPMTLVFENIDSCGGNSSHIHRNFQNLENWVVNMTVWLGC